MKLLQNALLAIVMLLGLWSHVDAQTQRMAIGAGTFIVGGGGTDGTPVDAYCLDRHRDTPKGTMINVLGVGATTAQVTRMSDGATLPLADAIQSGWISFHGQGTPEGLRANSEDGKKYRVQIKSPIALSEQAGDLDEDIAATLAWMGSPAAPDGLSVLDLWLYRDAEAIKALGGDVEYSALFGGLTAFWELRLTVDHADGKMIAISHSDMGADAYDRIVVSAHSPVRVFSGPNADREVVKSNHKKGENLEIVLVNPERLEHMAPWLDHIRDAHKENHNRYWLADAESAEERKAIEQMEMLYRHYRGVLYTAAAQSLLLADHGQGSLTVSAAPKLATASGGGGNFIISGGAIVGFPGGEPPRDAGLGASEPPDAVKALIKDEPKKKRFTFVPQGGSWWTAIGSALGAPQSRLDSVMSSTLAALMLAVRRDSGPDEVVSDVKEAILFNRKAYEAFKPVGTVQVRLFLDLEEKLDIRVAAIETPTGIRFVALQESTQTR